MLVFLGLSSTSSHYQNNYSNVDATLNLKNTACQCRLTNQRVPFVAHQLSAKDCQTDYSFFNTVDKSCQTAVSYLSLSSSSSTFGNGVLPYITPSTSDFKPYQSDSDQRSSCFDIQEVAQPSLQPNIDMIPEAGDFSGALCNPMRNLHLVPATLQSDASSQVKGILYLLIIKAELQCFYNRCISQIFCWWCRTLL